MKKIRNFIHMRKAILLLLVIGSIWSCKKHDPYIDDAVVPENTSGKGYIKLVFDARFNGAPFNYYTDYYNPLNQRVQFELLKFFLTDFHAKRSATDSIMFLDAFMYNHSSGLVSTSAQIDTGDYIGLRYGFGVDPSRNHLDPTLYDIKHPLSYNLANSMHWGWASGYIFMKMEGKADTSGTGTGPLDIFVAYHPGDDACYSVTPFLPKNFTINPDDTTVLTIRMDIDKFFTTAEDTIDFRNENLTHYTDNPGLARLISSNIAKSFVIL